MGILREVMVNLGLAIDYDSLPGRPDRAEQVRAQNEPRPVADARVQVSWGRGTAMVTEEDTDQAEGAVVFEYTVASDPVTESLPANLPWTVYDEQALAYEQARTRSFTARQYRELRKAYLGNPDLTNAQAGKLYDKSESWGAKRMRAVRKAVQQIMEDKQAGKPLPYPE